ncbi:uncharacterized protein LOC144682927 isoform X1 [Cetorhinus maximus]
MNPAPFSVCVVLLLALTAFTSSSASDATANNSSQTPNATSNPTTVKATIQLPHAIATMQTTNNTGNTTTVHMTSRPASTKSGNSTATTTTATSTNNTSAGIPTTALPIVSHFDVGSFVGGIVLTLGVIAVFYFGRRFCVSRSGTRYRTIEETEAII